MARPGSSPGKRTPKLTGLSAPRELVTPAARSPPKSTPPSRTVSQKKSLKRENSLPRRISVGKTLGDSDLLKVSAAPLNITDTTKRNQDQDGMLELPEPTQDPDSKESSGLEDEEAEAQQRPGTAGTGVSELMADALTLGRRVWYRGTVPCCVRYVGRVKFARGDWVGVEREDDDLGKHDGTVDGVAYFACKRPGKNALFVIPSMLSLGKISVPKGGSAPAQPKPSIEHILNANCRIHLMSARLLGFNVIVDSPFKGRFSRGRNRVEVTQAKLSTLTSREGIAFCEDKFGCSRSLAAGGIPVPRNEMIEIGSMTDFGPLLSGITIPYPLVIKTNWGYGGDGVFPFVPDTNAAVTVLNILKERGAKKVLFEERIIGDDYRVFLLDGVIRDVVLRQPAHVVGDGVTPLGTLIVQENEARQVVGRHIILPDDHYLSTKGITMDTVPAKDEAIKVQDKCNMALGGTTTRIDQGRMNENTLSMLRSIYKLLPAGQRVCGVDYMTTDITADYRVTNSMINEINATPSIDVHFYCDFNKHKGDWTLPHFVTYSAASWAAS